jgi:hypothetical protein
VTLNYSSVYRDWQKTRHRDTDANSSNRRAIIANAIVISEIDYTEKAM